MPTEINNRSNRRFFQIEFDEDKHLYYVGGKQIPSVTDILAPLHRSYGKINPSVLEYAAKRGTAVHEALQMLDLTGDLEWTPEITPYIQAYLEWCAVYKPTWLAVEKIVYSDDLGYAGTLDRMGYLNDGKLAVVDIKTSQPTKEAYISVCLQTLAYAYASVENYSEVNRYGLFLMKDGKYRLLDCKEWEKKNDLDSETLFAMILTTHKMIDEMFERRKKNDE